MKTASDFTNSPAWVKAITELFGVHTAEALNARAQRAADFANEEAAYEDDADADYENRGRWSPDFPINIGSEGH